MVVFFIQTEKTLKTGGKKRQWVGSRPLFRNIHLNIPEEKKMF